MASTSANPEATESKPQLNQRELEVIAKAWICITSINNGVPVIDSKKLAEIGPYASADSARHIWKPIEKKLFAIAGAPPPTPGAGRGKGTPRKRKADAAADGEDPGTPTKKPRARKNTKAATKKDEDDGDLADGEA
ncbi:hypothetical protein Hte_001836 [Hypoxylon texense]